MTNGTEIVSVNVETITKAFTEWDRRYREDPKGFETDFERLLRGQTPDNYGEEVTPYFLELLEAMSPQTPIS